MIFYRMRCLLYWVRSPLLARFFFSINQRYPIIHV